MKNMTFIKYNNFPDNEVLTNMRNYAIENDVPIIQDEGLAMLLYLVKQKSVKKVLEIGTAIGFSAINMALVNNEVLIDTIERDQNMYQEAISNISKLNLESRIRVFFEDALLISDASLEKDYDLIFIDAAKAQYIKFFEKFGSLLKRGGIIFSDNLLFHGLVYSDKEGLSKNLTSLVKKIESYNEYLKNNSDYDTLFLDIGDGVSVSVKKWVK